MKARSKKALAAAGVTLAVAAGGAGGAVAAGGNGTGRAGHPGPAAIASYLGLTPTQLRAQLRSGKTLAQIAVAQGKSVSGLEAAIYADVQAHLDQAVAKSRLSAAQEQTLLTRLKGRLDDIVNHAFTRARAACAPASRRTRRRLPRHHPGSASDGAPRRQVAGADRNRSRQDRRRAEVGDPRCREDAARQGGREEQIVGDAGDDDPRPALRAPRPARQPDAAARQGLRISTGSRPAAAGTRC